MSAYNWSAAFVAYCNNHPLEEISELLGIPLPALKSKASSDRWQALRSQLPLASAVANPIVPTPQEGIEPRDPFDQGRDKTALVPAQTLPPALSGALEKLVANRKTNYEGAAKLRRLLDTFLEQSMSSEGLQVEQLFHNKGQVVRVKRAMTTGDLVNIGTFMRTIHDMSYRALGDTTVQEGKGGDHPGGYVPTPPAIVINLPAAIAQPRADRTDDLPEKRAKVIEVETVSQSTDQPDSLSNPDSMIPAS